MSVTGENYWSFLPREIVSVLVTIVAAFGKLLCFESVRRFALVYNPAGA